MLGKTSMQTAKMKAAKENEEAAKEKMEELVAEQQSGECEVGLRKIF